MDWKDLPLFARAEEPETPAEPKTQDSGAAAAAPAADPVSRAVERAAEAARRRAEKEAGRQKAQEPQAEAEAQVAGGLETPRFGEHGAQDAALSVTELTQRLRGVLEPAFATVWVQGEISNYRPAASGHVYFLLKDSGASVSAAIFGWGKSQRMRGGRPAFELRDGLEVVCRGKISVYPPRGNYQLIVDHVEPLGAGALQLAFEQLKGKLAAEGLFAPERKRGLPPFPMRIAVVTSPSGAAIQDMLNILSRRAPHLEVNVIPAIVQGEAAPPQIIRGLELANRLDLGDVVVLARGGGSIEDLWCFNDEKLARAIVASRLPVISAVGHEIDFTISDFVADLRAPTPSAAAEIVTTNWVDLGRRLLDARARLQVLIQRQLAERATLLNHVTARLQSPRDRLREQAQRTDELFSRLERAFRVKLEARKSLVQQMAGQLDALSPLRVLERGYSIVRDAESGGTVIRSVTQTRPGQELEITFSDGQRKVRVP